MKLRKYEDWKSINESNDGSESSTVRNFINGTAWSACFISFVYKQADPTFPSASMHTAYATKLKSNPNWEVLDPSITPIKLGDIIVANRDGSRQKFQQKTWSGISHADIVVELTATSAKKIGGNTSSKADRVAEGTARLSNGILSEKIFFAVLRPKSEQVAVNAVEIAKAENEIWTTNGWTEHDTDCHTRLQAYYNAGSISIPGYDKVDANSIALVDKGSRIKTSRSSTGEISTGRKIYTLLNVVGEFMVMNGMWVGKLFTLLPEPEKGGPSPINKFKISNDWVPLEKFCELTAKLDKEHPGARSSADIELNRQKFCSTPEIVTQSGEEWMKELGGKSSLIEPGDEELARAQKEKESEERFVTTENCQISIPKSKKKGFLSGILDFSNDLDENTEIGNIIIVYPGSEEKSGFDTLEKFKGLLSGKFNNISEKLVVVFANSYDTDFQNIREDIEKEVNDVDEYTDYTLILFGHSAQNTDLIEDLSSTQNIKGLYLINPFASSSMVSSITKLNPNVQTGIYYTPTAWNSKQDKNMYLLNAISTHLKKSGKNESEFIAKVKSTNLEESIEKGLDFFKDKIDYVA